MKDYELLEAQARVMRMAEKYGVEDWHKLVRYTDSTYGRINAHCGSLSSNIDYQFALGVVEGKPVYCGDTLYTANVNGPRTISHVAPSYDGRECFYSEEAACFCEIADATWNPPKTKTVMVELTVEDAQTLKNWVLSPPVNQNVAEACRKALEAQSE